MRHALITVAPNITYYFFARILSITACARSFDRCRASDDPFVTRARPSPCLHKEPYQDKRGKRRAQIVCPSLLDVQGKRERLPCLRSRSKSALCARLNGGNTAASSGELWQTSFRRLKEGR